MKKKFFLVAAVLSVALVSCSKDDSEDGSGSGSGSGSGCTCTSTMTVAGVSTSTESSYTESEMSGRTCSELEDEINALAGENYTVECK